MSTDIHTQNQHFSELQQEIMVFSKMNLQSLYGDQFDEETITAMAKDVVVNRQSNEVHFEQRLQKIREQYSGDKLSYGTFLTGWKNNPIAEIKQEFGGVLLGLFHYGAHRHVVADLIAQGLEAVIPVAGKAYLGLDELIKSSAAGGSQLLQVEEGSVSRELLKAIKRGGIGCIYVDGNMGPDSTHANKEGQPVNFMHKQLSVKYGIARLSVLLKLPVLPVLTSANAQGKKVSFGELIEPTSLIAQLGKTQAQNRIMQSLYGQLSEQVRPAPEHWEFVTCMHRWVVAEKSRPESTVDSPLVTIIGLSVDSKEVSEMEFKDNLFWVNHSTAKAFKIPEALRQFFKDIYQNSGVDYREFCARVSGAQFESSHLLKQLHASRLVQLQ